MSAGEIASGFGIDFFGVRLDGFESIREILIDISGMQGGEAEFIVQVRDLIADELAEEILQNINFLSTPENMMIFKEARMSNSVMSAEKLEII